MNSNNEWQEVRRGYSSDKASVMETNRVATVSGNTQRDDMLQVHQKAKTDKGAGEVSTRKMTPLTELHLNEYSYRFRDGREALYLKAGTVKGKYEETSVRTPQGGDPLSIRPAIMFNEFGEELKARGSRFENMQVIALLQ